MSIVATVLGEPFTDLPKDLFIPPDALLILLDSFSGPLDLLLYLIRKQNMNIMDIPILKITRQYMQYIELMEKNRIDLAAEYLLMAAQLLEIKSRLLLPRVSKVLDNEEEDPRMTLVRRLQVYEQYKNAAFMLDNLVRFERDVFAIQIKPQNLFIIKLQPDVKLKTITAAIESLITKNSHFAHHEIKRETLSVKDRILYVLSIVNAENYTNFNLLFNKEEGRMGVVVSFLAILELARLSMLTIVQNEIYSPIYVYRSATELQREHQSCDH